MDNTPSEAVNAIGGATFPLVPTLASLTRVTAKAPMRKAVDENGIGGECFRAAPVQLARAWHPLAVKAVVTLRPPLQYRDGHLVELLNQTMHPSFAAAIVT